MSLSAPELPQLEREIESVYRLYAALACDLDPEAGLGGKLLNAGELTPETFRLIRAANIAGAATLCATADASLQRQAIREGVIDFLVTSLDEALRILKNEIRKRSAVAVCIGAPPTQILSEMLERGVLPDLLPAAAANEEEPAIRTLIAQGARRIEAPVSPLDKTFLVLRDPPPSWEARALALIPESDHAARRWMRLSPRYLGPAARRIRSLPCAPAIVDQLAKPV